MGKLSSHFLHPPSKRAEYCSCFSPAWSSTCLLELWRCPCIIKAVSHTQTPKHSKLCGLAGLITGLQCLAVKAAIAGSFPMLVGLWGGKTPGKQFWASRASRSKGPVQVLEELCWSWASFLLLSSIRGLRVLVGPACQGVCVLVYCLSWPEHPGKQGEKGLTHPAPLALTYLMWLEDSRMKQSLCHGDAWAAADPLVLLVPCRVPGGHAIACSLPGFICSNKWGLPEAKDFLKLKLFKVLNSLT